MNQENANSRRPWPIPLSPWVLRMRWRELLFAHWTVVESKVRALLPPGLELDLFEGRCYVGAVPFLMENVGPRGLPPVPGLHSFPELNLRTYVTTGGKPGVWFFSLDAGQKLAVRMARSFFYLPYFDAQFQIQLSTARVKYSAVRTHTGAARAEFAADYEAAGPVYRSIPGTLDSWLTDRYCLYSANRAGQIYRCEIDHEPWALQKAEAAVHSNTLGDWLGLEMKGSPETLHFAKSLDVRAWLLTRV